MFEDDITYIDLFLHHDSAQNKELNILDNELELFLQEIELAIKIAPGDIWGIPDNININRYVFNQYITLSQVKYEIQTYIANNCASASKFPWTVDAEFLTLEGKKILYITVTVTKLSEYDDTSEDFKASFMLGSD